MVTEALSLLFMILVNLTSVGGDGTKDFNSYNYNYEVAFFSHAKQNSVQKHIYSARIEIFFLPVQNASYLKRSLT